MGTTGQAALGRLASGVPPPQQEQSPIPASQALQQAEVMGFTTPGTASNPFVSPCLLT